MQKDGQSPPELAPLPVLMMPKSNPTRRLAAKAANKMEDVAWRVSDTISSKMDSFDM